MGLNPRHSGWYWYPLVHRAYREKDYAGALEYAMRVNLPRQFWTSLVSAMVHGQLGNPAEAAQAVKELLALKPDFQTNARQELEKWFSENAHVDHMCSRVCAKQGVGSAQRQTTFKSASLQECVIHCAPVRRGLGLSAIRTKLLRLNVGGMPRSE